MTKISELMEALGQDPLRTLVRSNRARKYHGHLLSRHTTSVDQELLEDAKLLTDRDEMLKRLPKGGVVAEVGVAEGDFSEQILEVCQPEKLHLIDPWITPSDARYSDPAFNGVKERFASQIASGQVEVHRDFSANILPKFADNYLDWIYIDAAHDFENVAAELALSRRVVKPDGIIAGHDYIRWVGPTTRYGVMEAVNDFAMTTRSPFVFLTNQFDKHDSFALRLNKAAD